MGGRPSKPTGLILMEGKSHRTKAEIEHRKVAEQALYTGFTFRESQQVRDNPEAHRIFVWLRRLYKKISYVDGLDEQTINRYCLEVANVSRLQQLADKLEAKLDEQELDTGDLIQLYKSINGVLGKINTAKDFLMKFEDRLFLNPTSRIKSIPKNPPAEEKAGGMAAFLKKRSEAQ